MTPPHSHQARPWLSACALAALALAAPPLTAQQPAPAEPAPAPAAEVVDYDSMDLQELFEKAGEFMEAGEWEKALKPLDILIKDYGADALDDYGPMFGVMHYRRGFCLKNLRKFDEALAEYEICNTKYANKPDTPAAKKNPVYELSRLEMGIVSQAKGDFEAAIGHYEAFAANPAPAGTYDDTAFRIQAASCYAKTGKPERGRQLIEQLFQATGAAAPKADALMRALLTLAEQWTSAPDPVAGATEAHQFLDQYGAKFSVSAFDMQRYEFNNRLIALARKATDNKQLTLAIRLIGFMASSSDVLEDLQGRAQRMLPAVSEALEKEIEKAKAQVNSPDALDWIVQLSLAGAYEQGGNPAAAFAVYQRCLQQLSASPHRELMLFGAMRASLALGQMDFAQRMGIEFNKEFPKSKFTSIVNTMQLESLFFTRQYAEALNLATRIRDTMEEKSPDRDLADFVVGASLFNLDRPLEAQPELTRHAETYPDSRFKEHVRFFAASCLTKLREWKEGGQKLDDFIRDFPASDYTPFAMFDRATCHFQLGDYQKCIEMVELLQKLRPDFPNLDSAVSLSGDSHLMLENNQKAEETYLQARELAAAAGPNHQIVLGRVLVQLVRVSKTLEKPEAVLQFYDEYMEGHKGGFYDAEIIVSAIAALKEAGRGAQALSELEQVIIRLGSGESGSGIEEAIGSYTEHSIEVSGPEALLDKLLEFVPRGVAVNNTLRAWLIMARIDLLQNDEYKDKFPRRAAQIQVAFEELRQFDKKELATYILVQVGRNLALQDKTETNVLAIEWFDEVLKRGESEHYALALMGKARILAASGDSSAFGDAIDAFDKVIRDLQDKPEYVEEAMLAKARLYYNKQQWQEASKVLFDMQSNSAFTRNRPEVFAKLARAYEEQGKLKEALEAYTPFVAPPFENYVEYSAEARVRAAEIVIKQGDLNRAFKLIKDTVSRMYKFANHPVAGPHVEKAKQLYKKLKADTQAKDDPDEGIWGVR